MINYAFEGQTWSSATVTWSFAEGNYSQDSGAGFSSFISQPQYQAVVELALQRWSAVTGIAFVEVADSPNSDIRIGWGSLAVSSSSEIGETSYFYNTTTNLLLPDVIIRLEDPSLDPLGGSSSTSYTYSGTVTTLYQTVLHEIGHALGMAHSTDVNAIMFPIVATTNPDLDASDIEGIDTLYGNGFSATASIAGADGTTVVVGFDSASNAAAARTLVNGVSGHLSNIDFVEAAGDVAEPSSDIAVVDDAVGPVTLVTNTQAHQSVVAGAGGLIFAAFGSGTVIAGAGDNQIFVTSNPPGPWDIMLGNGDNTVLAATGNETVAVGIGANLVFLGVGASSVASAGTDTIVGGAARDTIRASGNALVFSGAGGLAFSASAGTSTVVGGSGALSVAGGGGGGIFFGGGVGGNAITAGGAPSTVVGGGAGDFLAAAGSAADVIAGGPGAETISGTGATGSDVFFAGTGPELIQSGAGATAIAVGPGGDTLTGGVGYSLFVIADGHAGGVDIVQGFNPTLDHLSLLGYGAGAVATTLSAATISGGSTTLGLPDGTTIVFPGYTGLAAGSFV